jgi:hypothetical protein
LPASEIRNFVHTKGHGGPARILKGINMTPKEGIKFDYDLRANLELKGCETCVVCNEPLRCRWTDYSGEGVCLNCGTAYQLKWGSKQQEAEGNYPYCNMKEEWLPVVRDYWEKTHTFVFHGRSMSERTGLEGFWAWVKEHYPEKDK